MLRWLYLKTFFRFWFGAIWATVATAMLLLFFVLDRSDAQFIERAAVTDARVVEKGKEAKDGSTRCWLRYVWRDGGGREQVGLATTNWEQWRNLGDGDVVRVRYLADDPSRNRPILDEGDGAREGKLLGVGVAALFAAVGWGLVISALRQSGRRVALVRSGTVAQGSVLSMEAIQNLRVNRRNPVYLRVAYKDEMGRAHEVDSACLPPRLIPRWHAGDPVRVVYDPFEPKRCEVDIFDARG